MAIISENNGQKEEAYRLYKKAHSIAPWLESAKKNLKRFTFVSEAYADESVFDNSLYDKVLKKHLKDGKVDYKALRVDTFDLLRYIREIGRLDPGTWKNMSRNEKIALYINAYNAFTLKSIVDHYPVDSIKDIKGVWDKQTFTFAGKEITLNDIEHGTLRPKYKEPRVHFALVCASTGCPVLMEEPFTGENLDSQLNSQAERFLRDMSKNRLDRKKNKLYISSIFKWFKEDFGEIREFVTTFLSEKDAQYVRENKPGIKYLKYDWSLNKQ